MAKTKSLRWTSDIDVVATMITAGYAVVDRKLASNSDRGGRNEMLFGFEDTDGIRASLLQFASGQLPVDAKTLLQNKSTILSMVKNGRWEDG